ncbi:MAG: YraN family protein [Alphaproteobacteria bacterium]|nr:YraN family protein [Alphaproteobacteria bacterium]
MKKNAHRSGLFAEWLARQYLYLHGYKILESRFVTGRHTGRAEIDIIARRGNTIVFIEVKKRPDAAVGLRAVTFGQGVRLRRAADTFLTRMRWTGNARFDIIIVSGLRIRWFKNSI